MPLLALSLGCAGDDGSSTSSPTATETSPTTSGSTGVSSTTAGTTMDETMTGTETVATSMTTSMMTSMTTSTTTTGGEGPPDYPPPVDGICPEGTAQVAVGDGEVCGPFCRDAGSVCPDAGLGDATSICEGFLGESGSMMDCSMGEACIPGEECDVGVCKSIIFWSCLVDCGPGSSCPEPMFCSDQNKCAYPL